jgi:hypothetical protein
VNAIARSPGAYGDAKSRDGEKYSVSTPLPMIVARPALSGAASRKSRASPSVTKMTASAYPATLLS